MADQEVKLKITTDASGAVAGMKKASDEMKRFERASGSISGMIKRHWASIASAITVTSMAYMAKSVLDSMENVNKMSQKVGMSVEALQGYQYAARLADVENETLGKGLAKLAKNMYDAASGSRDMQSNFAQLGLSATDSAGRLKTTDVMLEDIAERFSRMKDGTEKTAMAMKLFGKSGAELIPFLNEGREGLRGMREEAEKLGIILRPEDVARAEEFNDNLTRLELTFKGIASRAMADVLPILINVSEAFIENIKDGKGLKTTVEGLGDAFRILVSFGVGVVATFDIIGTAIAGLAVKAMNFMGAVKDSADIISTPGWAVSWSQKADLLKKTWATGVADIGLGEDLEKKMESYGSILERVWDRSNKAKAKLPKAGGGGYEGGTGGTNDELSQAMISWREKIEALNPYIDRFDKQLVGLEKEAEKLVQKFGDQKWILEGLAQGKYFIEMARDMEETKKVLGALYETEKKYQELAQTWDLKKNDINAQTSRTALDRERKVLEEQSRYGLVTSAEQVEKQLDLDRRALEIDRKRMLSVIAIKSINAETEEQMTEINGLAYELLDLEQQIADLEDIRLLRLREYTGTFTEGVQSGMAQYAASLESNFQRGVNVAQDAADSMKQGFNDFFDHTSDGFMDLGNLATKVMNDISRSLIENLISKPLAAGLGSFVTGLLSGNGGHEAGHAFPSAHGNVFAGATGLAPYVNTVVSRPTVFRFAHGVGLMGEAGAEAIIPLVKTRSGDLGVRSEGNQASPPKVTLVVNNMGQPVTARHETTQVNAQETVVTLWLDAYNRNAYGLKSGLGG
jgi:lambda family phage tail tape measure protein